MVNYTLNQIFQHLSEDEKIKLLKSLIEITEGRIYVEVNFFLKIFSSNSLKQLKVLQKSTLQEMIKKKLQN